jgi:hypothetical protein
MAGEQFKYSDIISLYHMEDGIDAIGDNDLSIVGATTVPSILDNGQQGDGVNDTLTSDALVADLASVTSGTVFGWAKPITDQGAGSRILFSVSNKSSATIRELIIVSAQGAIDSLTIFARIGGVLQFAVSTETGSLPHSSQHSIVINHNDTEVSNIWIDGVDQALNFTTTLDKSIWFSDVIADGADTSNFLSLNRNGSFIAQANALLDEWGFVKNVLWDTDDVAAFHNGGAGQIVAPSAVNTTTVGVATAVASGTTTIDISMPYTDDDNADSTYTVDYKLSEDTSYTNWVTGAANTPSPYTNTITGLLNGRTYDVRMTYIDPDGVTGTNPQTVTDILLAWVETGATLLRRAMILPTKRHTMEFKSDRRTMTNKSKRNTFEV